MLTEPHETAPGPTTTLTKVHPVDPATPATPEEGSPGFIAKVKALFGRIYGLVLLFLLAALDILTLPAVKAWEAAKPLLKKTGEYLKGLARRTGFRVLLVAMFIGIPPLAVLAAPYLRLFGHPLAFKDAVADLRGAYSLGGLRDWWDMFRAGTVYA